MGYRWGADGSVLCFVLFRSRTPPEAFCRTGPLGLQHLLAKLLARVLEETREIPLVLGALALGGRCLLLGIPFVP